ncbi:MAG: hypothetical protein AAB533_02130 [Patescibacteria group bacterium]
MRGIVQEFCSFFSQKDTVMQGVLKQWMAVVVAVFLITVLPSGFALAGGKRVVYTASNNAGGNEVIAINLDRDGAMTVAATASTGGVGAPGLGNQGGVLATDHGVVAVNAGSNTIAYLRYKYGTLTLSSVVDSGGVRPISLTRHDNEVCVLNAGSAIVPANVSCFKLDGRGDLNPIPGATQPLGLGKGPAQVSFCGNGHVLAVTAKATNEILTVPVHGNSLGGVMSFDTTVGAGRVPFGFRCADNVLVTTFAASTLPGTPSGAGSFLIGRDGSVIALTPFASDTRQAACWLALSEDNRLAYVVNTPTRDISGYEVADDGQILLVSEVYATVGVPVTDAAVVGGVFLVVSPSAGEVVSYVIRAGGLTLADTLVLSPGINGVDGK